MERYKIMRQLGDGTYGEVLKAQHKQTGPARPGLSASAKQPVFAQPLMRPSQTGLTLR